MGRQINFFLLKEDMLFIYDEVIKRGAYIIYEDGNPLQREDIDDNFVFAEKRQKRYYYNMFYIVNRRSHLTYDYAENIGRRFLSQTGSDSIGYLEISFGNERHDINGRTSGRIYYKPYYLDNNDEWAYQPEEYTKLFTSLRRKLKKEFIIDTSKNWYMGPACYEAYKSGAYICEQQIQFD